MEETVEFCENSVNTFWCELTDSSVVLLLTEQSTVKWSICKDTESAYTKRFFNNLGLVFVVLANIPSNDLLKTCSNVTFFPDLSNYFHEYNESSCSKHIHLLRYVLLVVPTVWHLVCLNTKTDFESKTTGSPYFTAFNSAICERYPPSASYSDAFCLWSSISRAVSLHRASLDCANWYSMSTVLVLTSKCGTGWSPNTVLSQLFTWRATWS